MTKSVYNQFTDEVGGKKAPHSLHACKTGTRLTDCDLTEINLRITQHNYSPTTTN